MQEKLIGGIMARGNRYFLERNQKYYPGCKNNNEICHLVDELEGAQNRRIPLFIQFLFTFISWLVIANNKNEGIDWFNSLFFFSTPMFLEYFSYKSKEKAATLIFNVQKFIFGFTALLGSIGVFTDVLTIKINNNTSYIKISESFFTLKGVEIDIKWIIYLLFIAIGLILTQTFTLSSRREEVVASPNNAA